MIHMDESRASETYHSFKLQLDSLETILSALDDDHLTDHDNRGINLSFTMKQDSDGATDKGLRRGLPYISGSVMLYTAAQLEWFTRSRIGEFAEEIVDKSVQYPETSTAIRKAYKARLLEAARTPGKYQQTDDSIEEYLRYLTSVNFGSDCKWNSSILTATTANLRPEVLQELLKRVGCEKSGLFNHYMGQYEFLEYFGKTPGDKYVQSIDDELNDLINWRNKLAHPRSSTDLPGISLTRVKIRFSSIFALHLDGYLELVKRSLK